MTKANSVAFILFKIVILLVLAIPLGLMLGYGISWIAVFLFNRFIGLDHSIALSGKAVGISIFICVVTVFLGSLWSIRKINRLSPISLFSPADTEQLHREKSSGKSIENRPVASSVSGFEIAFEKIDYCGFADCMLPVSVQFLFCLY